MVSTLSYADGEELGKIRLKLQDGMVTSNFKKPAAKQKLGIIAGGEEWGEDITAIKAEGEDNIPIAMFQRAFERLFYVLADEEPFDAQVVDKNRNGYVGWGEFAYVFKKKAITIR